MRTMPSDGRGAAGTGGRPRVPVRPLAPLGAHLRERGLNRRQQQARSERALEMLTLLRRRRAGVVRATLGGVQ